MDRGEKIQVLFLCVGNSARSQMAEGWARALRPDLEAASAGAFPVGLDPRAVRVMAEAGVDISSQRSKHFDEFRGRRFDQVVSLCSADVCPVWPGAGRQIRHEFDDPVTLSSQAATGEEALRHFRRVRDQLRDFILALPAAPEARPTILQTGGKP